MKLQLPRSAGLSVAFLIGACLTPSQGRAAERTAQRDSADAVKAALAGVPNCPPCVVHIKVPRGRGYTTGTGVLLPGGRVLTAAHVVAPQVDTSRDVQLKLNSRGIVTWIAATVEPPREIEVVFPGRASSDGSADAMVTVDVSAQSPLMSDTDLVLLDNVRMNDNPPRNLALSPGRSVHSLARGGDLALLRLPQDRIPVWAVPARVAEKGPRPGEWLVSVGLESPDAIRVHVAKLKGFMDGDSALIKDDPDLDKLDSANPNDPFMIVEVQAQAGDSGGPVFNTKGELVGINTAIGSAQHEHRQQGWLTYGHPHPCSFLGSHSAIKKFLEGSVGRK